MSTEKRRQPPRKTESGVPGGGAGRKDEVGRSGVFPPTGVTPPEDAEIVMAGAWGQGERGAAGYPDHGESELYIPRVTPEKCRDIMTKDPVFCEAGDSVVVAAKLMLEHDIGALPVAGTLFEKELIGIVTDRDLAMRVVAGGHRPEETTVSTVMSSPPVTCSPDDPYDKALELMEKFQVRRIPVTDNDCRIVGIISEADIALRIPHDPRIEEVVRSVTQPKGAPAAPRA